MQTMIKEIRDRLNKSTPAPWDIGDGGELSLYGGENSVVKKGGRVIVSRAIYGSDFDKQTYIDVDFIANSPADINYLLEALQEAQEVNIRLTNIKNTFYDDLILYKKSCDELVTLKEKLYDDIEQSQDRERVLREALEFYAIKDNYQEQLVSNEDDGWDIYRKPTIVLDNGKIAREALGQEGKYMDDEWIGMKEEVLQQIETVILNHSEDDCIVENYIVTEFISALRAERRKVAELQKINDSYSEHGY